jgi:hypothetical protein
MAQICSPCIAAKMTQEQIDEAQGLVRNWKPKLKRSLSTSHGVAQGGAGILKHRGGVLYSERLGHRCGSECSLRLDFVILARTVWFGIAIARLYPISL